MTRTPTMGLLAFTWMIAACSSTTNEAANDGGLPEPDGGVPSSTAPCVVDGYPCSPAGQSEAALELSERYKAEIQARRVNGDSYLDIAAWLRDQEGVVDVVAADNRIRFRVEGGAAHWMYMIGSEYPGIELRSLEETAAAASASAARGASQHGNAVVPKRILREDNSDTKTKKKGLILEPFHFQLPTDARSWESRLEALHDYDTVQYAADNGIPDQFFSDWAEYRFVWVLSHGAYLPEHEDPGNKYTAIFSAEECGLSAWISEEIGAGRGEDPIKNGVPIASLDGLDPNLVESQLKEDQLTRWRAFRDEEQRELEPVGKGCGILEVPNVMLRVPDAEGNPIRRDNAFLGYIYYDEAWFATHYGNGIENTLLHLSVCSSLAVPITGAAGSPSAILGWTQPNNSVEDEQAANLFFERLVDHGEMVGDAHEAVQDAELDEHMFEGVSTKLTLSSFGGGQRARIREIVSIIDKDTGELFPDIGGTLEPREITAEGDTVVDVTVEVVGFGKRMGKEFEVQFFDGNGQAISQKLEVDEPTDGKTVMTIPVSLNQAIASPTEVDLEARVTLPEDSGSADSRHPITVTVGAAIEPLWTLSVGGGGTARGDFVFAPFPTGLVDVDGRLVWQVTLAQLSELVPPLATLFIVDHNGRAPDCTGEIGNFEALVSIMFNNDPAPTEGFGGGLGEGECGDSVNVEIVSFSREDDLVANVSGTVCHWRQVGEEVVVTPVPINGSFQMPAAGCGADPGGDLVGSYHATEEPSLCIDIYPNAAIAPAFEDVCSMGGGLVCSDEPCSRTGQVGECDYRSAAVQITFRGQVQHFLPGGDWPPAGDLQTACELQLGTWTTGVPTP